MGYGSKIAKTKPSLGPKKSGCFSGGASRNGSIERFYPSQSQDMILSGQGPSKTDPEQTEAEKKAADQSRVRKKADDVGSFRYERSVQKGGAKDPNEGMVYGKASNISTSVSGAVKDLDRINPNLSTRSQSDVINKATKISGFNENKLHNQYISRSGGTYDYTGDLGLDVSKSNQFHDALKTGASQYTSEGKHKTMKEQTGLKSKSGTFGKISGGAAKYITDSYAAGKIGEPDSKDNKIYIGETDSDRSNYQKRFDKKNPGARDSDAISRYRIEKEYDPSGVYYTGDSNMYSKDKTMVPGIRNPNYNPGSNATAEFNKSYPNIKNIAAKSSMINKAALATFGGNTSDHNKGFMQNKGNYGVGQVNDFGGVNNSGNKQLFNKNLKQAHDIASTPLNVKSAKATFGKVSTPSNQEFNSLTRKVISNPNSNTKSNRRKSKGSTKKKI